MKKIILFISIFISIFAFPERKATLFLQEGVYYVRLELREDQNNGISCELTKEKYEEVKDKIKCLITPQDHRNALTGPNLETMSLYAFNCNRLPTELSFVLKEISLNEVPNSAEFKNKRFCSFTAEKSGLIGVARYFERQFLQAELKV